MDSKTIIKNSKKLHIHLFLDYETGISNKDKFVLFLTKDLKISDIGYAGFNTKKNLNQYLKNEIFLSKKEIKIRRHEIKNGEITYIIKKTIYLCQKFYGIKNLNIFIFPSFSLFVKNKMAGVTGFTPWKNTILLFINPAKDWKQSLKGTVAHEFCHVAMLENHNWTTFLDSIIFEGLAENFREHVVGGKRTPWSRALNLNQSKKLFQGLIKDLHSKDPKLYNAVFFGDKKYSLWSGYAIGYHIVHSFLKNNSGLKWKQIIALSTEEILKRSGFIKNSPK